MKFLTASSALALAAGLVVAPTVSAQEQPISSVYEKARPDFDAPGSRSGSFIFNPEVNVTGAYDSNIFAQRSNVTDDFIVRIKPGFSLDSDWNNNSFSMFANADIGQHFDNTRENYEDFNFGMNGRIDLSRGTSISANVGYSDLHEDRGSPNQDPGRTTLNVGAPANQTTFQVFTAGVGFLRDEAIVSLAVDGNYTRNTFDNPDLIGGGVLNNSDRDHEIFRGSARVGYDLDDTYEAFLRLSANRVEYDDSTVDGGPQRNSDGWEIVGGTSFNLTGTAEGEVFFGYIDQEYDSDSLGDISDITFGASILWNPTGLTSVRFGASRGVTETIVADVDSLGNPTASSAILGTTFDLQVEHELRRNVLLKGTASYVKQDFENTVREDDLINASLGTSYLLNRNWSVDATYEFRYRDTTARGQDFKRHIFMVGLTAKW